MAGEIVNFDSSEVIFGRYTSETKFIESKTNEIEHYFIGQHVTLLLKLKLSKETVNRLKSVHPPGRSPLLENINTSIKRQLNHGVDVRYKVVPLKKLPSIALHSSTDCLTCHVTASQHEESEQQNEQSLEPTFSCDKKFYHKPVRVTIPELPFETSLASLVILIQPACKHTPRWLSSPAKLDTFDNLQEVTNDKAEGGKLVSRKFKVIHPPFMMFQQISVGSQKTVFLEVSNLSQKPAVIKECFFKPAICPKSGTSLPCKKETTNERPCLLHSDNIVTLMNDQGTIFPVCLLPGERVSLAANINVNALHNSCLKDELSWEAQLTWAIDKDSMKQFTIATTYRLPNLKLKKGLFIMSACCNKSSFKKGERVCITYSIQNNLHEFLSIRLSWQPPSEDEQDNGHMLTTHTADGLVCEEPSVLLGACQVGETMEAKVHFRALRLGLYEVCKHMKVNLRYSIPVSDSSTMTSQTSPLSTQSDDPQMLHSTLEDIGGIQSNSRLTASDFVPKLSPHHKSLSFSDLGQDISDELFTSGKRRDPQSPWLQKNIRSLSAVEYEKLLLSADNFIKNSCLVKVDNY